MNKLLKTLLFFLSNQKGELGDGGDYSNLDSYLESDNLETESEVEQGGEEPVVDGQAEEQPQGDENDLKSQLDKLEIEDGDAVDILGQINQLNLMRNGMPFEYEDIEKVKEDLMKGFDYTQKTQELAEQRKQSETELAEQKQQIEQQAQQVEQLQAEHEQTLHEYKLFTEVLRDVQMEDPDLFSELELKFAQKERMFSSHLDNPMYKSLQGELGELKNQLGQFQQKEHVEKLDNTKQEWEDGLTATQKSYGTKLRSLAVKPNWSKVQEVWKSDSTGQMSVEQAFFATHGKEIQAALEAKSKNASTKLKSTMRRGGNTPEEQPRTPEKPESYMDAVMKIASQYT